MRSLKILIHSLIFSTVALLFNSCGKDIKQEIIFEAGVVDTIHFNYSNQGHIAVPLKIDSTVYDFIFDTGASATLFDDEIAIDTISNHTSIFLDYYGEKRTLRLIWPQKIELGKVSFLNFEDFQQTGLSIDGILGNNILRELCWVIDFKNDRIYATKDIKNLKLQLGDGLPFTLRNNMVYVNALVGKVTLPLLIDTGAPSATIGVSNRYLDKENMSEMIKWQYYRDPMNMYNETKPVVEDSSYETILPLKLGDRIYGDELIKYVTYREHAGVGLGFLSRFDQVIFDYPNRQIYLLGQGHKTVAYHIETNEALNGSGILVGLKDSLVIVKGLSNQAKKEGLKLGDIILGIDDVIFSEEVKTNFFEKQKREVSYIQFNNGEEKTTIVEETIDSKFEELQKNFRNLNKSSVMHIIRGNDTLKVEIEPRENYMNFPDTLQTNYDLNPTYFKLFYSNGFSYKNEPMYYLRKKLDVEDSNME